MNQNKESQDKCVSITFKNRGIKVPYAREREMLNASNHGDAAWHIQKIQSEFVKGYDFLSKFDRSVTFFGSARNGFDPEVYEEATKFAYFLAKRGFAVFTGGGPGIMEAANKGAHEAGGISIGININLPQAGDDRPIERRNKYVDRSESFDFFFSRKVILTFASQFYIFFPGGFGTMDELFEMLTLIQTRKIAPVPILLVGKKFWEPLVAWIEEAMLKDGNAINPDDMELFHLVDNAKEGEQCILECIRENNHDSSVCEN